MMFLQLQVWNHDGAQVDDNNREEIMQEILDQFIDVISDDENLESLKPAPAMTEMMAEPEKEQVGTNMTS